MYINNCKPKYPLQTHVTANTPILAITRITNTKTHIQKFVSRIQPQNTHTHNSTFSKLAVFFLSYKLLSEKLKHSLNTKMITAWNTDGTPITVPVSSISHYQSPSPIHYQNGGFQPIHNHQQPQIIHTQPIKPEIKAPIVPQRQPLNSPISQNSNPHIPSPYNTSPQQSHHSYDARQSPMLPAHQQMYIQYGERQSPFEGHESPVSEMAQPAYSEASYSAVRICLVCNSIDKVSTTFKVCHACHQFLYKYKMLNWNYPACKLENNCIIDVNNRKCRSCRINKAKSVGIELEKFGQAPILKPKSPTGDQNGALSGLQIEEVPAPKPKRLRAKKQKVNIIRNCRICQDTHKVTAKTLICHACHQFLYKCRDGSRWEVRPCRTIGGCEVSPLIRKCRCCRLVKAKNVGVDLEKFGISEQAFINLERASQNMSDNDDQYYGQEHQPYMDNSPESYSMSSQHMVYQQPIYQYQQPMYQVVEAQPMPVASNIASVEVVRDDGTIVKSEAPLEEMSRHEESDGSNQEQEDFLAKNLHSFFSNLVTKQEPSEMS